jgi:hypothetical protein
MFMGEDPQLWHSGVKITLICMEWSHLCGCEGHLYTWKDQQPVGCNRLSARLDRFLGQNFVPLCMTVSVEISMKH